MVSLEQEGNIFIVYLPVAFRPEIIREIHSKLDIVENHPGPTALIFSSKNPKIFSAGMDLKYMMNNGIDAGLDLFKDLMKLFGRVLALSVPSISAIRGHAAAAGLMLALTTDYRVMSKDIGSVKMTEVALGMTLPRGGNIVLKAKLHPSVHRDLLLRARVFSPSEALESKIVDELVESSEVLHRARELAKSLEGFGERKEVYRMLKTSTYKEEIDLARVGAIPEEEYTVVRKTFSPKL